MSEISVARKRAVELLGEFGRGALSAKELFRAWPTEYEHDELLDEILDPLREPEIDRYQVSDAQFAAVAIRAMSEDWNADAFYDALFGPAGNAHEAGHARRRSFWIKAAILAVILTALGWTCIGGVCLVFWKATHKQETEEARMRRLVEQLGARETYIRFLDMNLYRTHKRDEAKREILAQGKRAVPFLIEGLHHENGLVGRESADLLIDIPTKEGIAALIRCLGEGEKPVPRPFDVHANLEGLTGYSGGLDPPTFDDERDKDTARRVWEQWWEEYKDRLVETPRGLGIRQYDGTVTPLPATWGPDPLRPGTPRG